jgi:pyrimidine operon attenuation protein / uracil phosphoribosyltransferase
MKQNSILTAAEIKHKIKRISYQIYETFVDENEIIIAGIAPNGYVFAKRIATSLETISNLKITLCEVTLYKENDIIKAKTSLEEAAYTNKPLVLVDDVLNSGTALIYAVKHFLDVPLKKFKTAVLVDRNHKKFPVKADFKGISLSTSLQERVEVVFNEDDNDAVLLS